MKTLIYQLESGLISAFHAAVVHVTLFIEELGRQRTMELPENFDDYVDEAALPVPLMFLQTCMIPQRLALVHSLLRRICLVIIRDWWCEFIFTDI